MRTRRQLPLRNRRTAAALAMTVLLLGAGCGDEESPAEAAPELSARLEKVDAAIEDEDYARARDAVRALVNDTAQAEVAGDISDEQADRILQAAAALLDQLPDQAGDDVPEEPSDGGLPGSDPITPDESDEPAPEPDPGDDGQGEDDQGEDDQGNEDKDGGNDKDEGKKPDKGKKDKDD